MDLVAPAPDVEGDAADDGEAVLVLRRHAGEGRIEGPEVVAVIAGRDLMDARRELGGAPGLVDTELADEIRKLLRGIVADRATGQLRDGPGVVRKEAHAASRVTGHGASHRARPGYATQADACRKRIACVPGPVALRGGVFDRARPRHAVAETPGVGAEHAAAGRCCAAAQEHLLVAERAAQEVEERGGSAEGPAAELDERTLRVIGAVVVVLGFHTAGGAGEAPQFPVFLLASNDHP